MLRRLRPPRRPRVRDHGLHLGARHGAVADLRHARAPARRAAVRARAVSAVRVSHAARHARRRDRRPHRPAATTAPSSRPARACSRPTTTGPMALVVLDIDDFKGINDRFGHPVGDEVLRSLADSLRTEFGADGAFRVGGEEFAVLLAGHRRRRGAHDRPRASTPPRADARSRTASGSTISAGIAVYPEMAVRARRARAASPTARSTGRRTTARRGRASTARESSRRTRPPGDRRGRRAAGPPARRREPDPRRRR